MNVIVIKNVKDVLMISVLDVIVVNVIVGDRFYITQTSFGL